MCYQNVLSKFKGVYSRDNLPDKIKDGAYVINLDEYFDVGTHSIALYVNTKTVTYFDSFGVEHIPKEIKKIMNNKNIIAIECNSVERSNQQSRLNKINEIKDYFIAEIKERELMIERLIYIASFDNSLIVLSASASLSLAFSLSTGLVKKIIKNNKK